MKKKQNAKTPRNFSEVSPPSQPSKKTLQEYAGFSVGDRIFFNSSLVNVKYHMGTIREIVVQSEEIVIFNVWDDEKGMWRSLHPQSVYSQKPKNTRGKR